MDKATSAVKNFLSNHGKEDTKVTETVNPAVTHENVTPTRHENVTTAVDKEVHQDHYHTSVQPVKDTQVLPEQHKHNLVGVEHRTVDHGNSEDVQRRLAAEKAKHQDERVVSDTKHTHSINPSVAGEHRHHHLHETIQPVIERQTIQPEVVHTTVPVHETHHEAAKHHTSSTLPAMTMNEFQSGGGALTGRGERTDTFEGAPGVGSALSGSTSGHQSHHTGSSTGTSGITGTTGHHTGSTTGHHSGSTTGHHTGSGLGSTTGTTGTTGLGSHSGSTGTTSGLGSTSRTHNGTGYSDADTSSRTAAATGTGAGLSGTGSHGTTSSSTHKPSLLDKLNPKKDADGDGKPGFMS